jgi:mercuric ion binding protein
MVRYCFTLLLTLLSATAWADPDTSDADRHVFLSVPGMTCSVCPITVRKALSGVPGVAVVRVDYENRMVAVRMDPARTSVQRLVLATAEAGYPPELVANLTTRQLHWLQTSFSSRP